MEVTDDLQKRVAATTELFRQTVAGRGEAITSDDRVSEKVAARLVGYEVRSLQNLRTLGTGPAYYRRPFAGSNVSYRLGDLAFWIENSREVEL